MDNSWESYEKAAEKGPLPITLKVAIFFLLLSVILGIIGYFGGWFNEAGQVAQEQFGPKAALAKYEEFKNQAAALDQKKADITVYEGRLKNMDETYSNLPRQKWPREDREQYNTWQSEVAGIKASYNSLAGEYNANMAKFNYSFANIGDLPAGADQPLPREFKPYITE